MVSEEITVRLTREQAEGLYRLIYDHGHWESKLFFPVENTLIDALEIDDEVLEQDREGKDKGVGKLFTLYREGGPQALAEALGLGTPEAINMEASAWQDLEAVWFHVSVNRSQSVVEQPKQTELQKPFHIASVCRADLQGILTDAEIAQFSNDEMEDIADRMSDAYRDTGGYWEGLEIIARLVLKKKEESIEQEKVSSLPHTGLGQA